MTDGPAPSREGTVFISYARADDEKPPMPNAPSGWVTFFWDQLRWELTDRGAKYAKLWLDRYEIEPAEAFTPAIENAVREARLIVPVLSENCADSDWCRREIETFGQCHPDAVERVVPVVKYQPPREKLPELLRGPNAREGYRFFVQELTGEVREFYWRGLRDENAYFETLKRIARYIIERLGEDFPERLPPVSPNGRTIYVAVAARELRDARQRLVNDLAGAGFAVVPAEDDLPDAAEDCAEAVRDALARAELAVHLLGDNPGVTPGGGSVSILQLQLDLARETTAAGRALPRVLWAPRWLPGRTGSKRDPIEVAGRFGGLLPGEEIYGEEVTDLSQWLRRRLEPPPGVEAAPPRPTTCLLVASAHPDDDEDAADLANRLQGTVTHVRPIFADEVVPDVGGAAVAAIVAWRSGDRQALDALLERLPPDARVTCLRLPGGNEAAKRRFFKEGVYVERLDALPPDRRTARGLLDRLEIMETER
jgi:hypothetical protein